MTTREVIDNVHVKNALSYWNNVCLEGNEIQFQKVIW